MASLTLEYALSRLPNTAMFLVFAAIGLTSRSSPDYGDYYQDTASSSLSERATTLFTEMGKAIETDNNYYSNKYSY